MDDLKDEKDSYLLPESSIFFGKFFFGFLNVSQLLVDLIGLSRQSLVLVFDFESLFLNQLLFNFNTLKLKTNKQIRLSK